MEGFRCRPIIGFAHVVEFLWDHDMVNSHDIDVGHRCQFSRPICRDDYNLVKKHSRRYSGDIMTLKLNHLNKVS